MKMRAGEQLLLQGQSQSRAKGLHKLTFDRLRFFFLFLFSLFLLFALFFQRLDSGGVLRCLDMWKKQSPSVD